MSGQVTLEQVEQQAAQLPPHEQLKLVAHISERLSRAVQTAPTTVGDESTRQQQEQEAAGQHRPLYPTRPQPPETLTRLIGLVAVGGDALADSEALYDADWP
ncbi:MAG TPA: hypothetical protein VGX03_18875 [Candidatus Binatia bacterium]|jgi:hypothetical protein|nr:hypothetical protein [Candidatus Binatia bacterium]